MAEQKNGSTAESLRRWLVGLRDQAAPLAAVVAAFWVLLNAHLQTAAEDRALFREAVATLSAAQERQWQAIRTLAGAVRRLADRADRDADRGEPEECADCRGCGCTPACDCGQACRCGPLRRCGDGCDCLSAGGKK